MDDPSRILVRATNWVGDAVMSVPALAALRARFPAAHIAILARPWVAELYLHEPFADEVIPSLMDRGITSVACRLEDARLLKSKRFDCALLLPNAFDAAFVAWMARIPRRIGYARDGRSPLLTDAIHPPRRGEIPAHESYYYLELLRRVGWLDQFPSQPVVRLAGAARAREEGRERWLMDGVSRPIIGVSPGAAFGTAKRWFPERFAETAAVLAQRLDAVVALFGSASEAAPCLAIQRILASRGIETRNFAGATSLGEFLERAAACVLFLTNDSGAMHIASALGVPTVAVFGATNHLTTGPTGPLVRVVRCVVECSPCQLRHCPIDHRCMAAVEAAQVVDAALDLLQEERSGHAQ